MLEQAIAKIKGEMEQNSSNPYIQVVGNFLAGHITENPGDAERLQTILDKKAKELEQANNRIEDLTRQLNEKPIDAPAIIKEVPKEIEEELNSLRHSQKSVAAMQRYRVHFEALVKGFQDILGALAEIEQADPDVHEQYKKAVSSLIDKMADRL